MKKNQGASPSFPTIPAESPVFCEVLPESANSLFPVFLLHTRRIAWTKKPHPQDFVDTAVFLISQIKIGCLFVTEF